MLIPSKLFECGLTKLCDTENQRWAIGGVQVSRTKDGKPRATVTDGRRLLVVEWEEDAHDEYPSLGLDKQAVVESKLVPGFSALVPAKLWDDVGKKIPKRTPKLILRNALLAEKQDEELRFYVTDLEQKHEVVGRQLEGRFPDLSSAFPKYHAGNSVTITLNAALLAGLLQVLAKGLTVEVEKRVTLTVPIVETTRPVIKLDCEGDGVTATALLCCMAGDVPGRAAGEELLRERLGDRLPAAVIDALADVLSYGQVQFLVERLCQGKQEDATADAG